MNRVLTMSALLALSTTTQALTPAGTEIINQASAEYIAPESMTPSTAVSNVIRTVVQAVCSVSVTPDGTVAQPGQSAALLPGEGAIFTYTVVNTGNTTEAFPSRSSRRPGPSSPARASSTTATATAAPTRTNPP